MKINKKSIITYSIIFLSTTILSIILAFFIKADYTYQTQGNVREIFPGTADEPVVVSYERSENNFFVAQGEDPQLVFNSIDYNIESILINFSAPINNDISVQTFFHTPESHFNEMTSCKNIVHKGDTQLVINTPFTECLSLRIDINGDFSLDSILLSDSDYNISIAFGQINFFQVLVIDLFLVILIYCAFVWFKGKNFFNKLTMGEMTYCLACGLFYFKWSLEKALNYGPDENMRYNVSLFLFNNNRLPINTEAIEPAWGFSYAHLPTVLCNLFSYIPMKIVSLFTDDEFCLLLAARFVSVVCGALTVYFVKKAAKRLFKSHTKWIMIVFISMIPQFIFLSSYLNNDIVALFGASMIFYSWVISLKCSWSVKSSVIMAIGISICALAYYNSYGWILSSVLLIISYFIIYRDKRPSTIKFGLMISAIVLLLISYMFIRHYVIYGDFLGLDTSNRFGEAYAMDDALKPSNRLTIFKSGISIFDMLFSMGWLISTYKSYIEVFGPMSVLANSYVYYIYSIVFALSIVVLVVYAIMYLRLNGIKKSNLYLYFYYFLLVATIILPVILSVILSYTSGYQPQGRYCYPSIISVAFLVTKSVEVLVDRIKKKERQYAVVSFICSMLIFVTVSEYFVTYLPS